MSLLYKGWENGSTDVPPTRHVASGNVGMNLHLSELLSDILEPVVGTLDGGTEVISTEDLLAQVDELNARFSGWHDYIWWEGKRAESFQACSNCPGSLYYKWDRDDPELCTCGRDDMVEDGYVRTTVNFVKVLRRQIWEEKTNWDPSDMTREFTTKEMLEEEVQNYTYPMVVIWSDVVSLYPNPDVIRCSEIMREAILMSPIVWESMDYLECSRYVALNWNHEKCRASSLRRILPWRRKIRGSRPGMKGCGPRGKLRGDTEQWVFPRVVLTETEKKDLVATVVQIMTEALFENHFYTFGNKTYHQKGGGPIGLRGTCAVARVTMQMFDILWKRRLDNEGVVTWLLAR